MVTMTMDLEMGMGMDTDKVLPYHLCVEKMRHSQFGKDWNSSDNQSTGS